MIHKSPCFECKDRILYCHNTCERYKEYKQKLEKINKSRKEATLKNTWTVGSENAQRKRQYRKRKYR